MRLYSRPRQRSASMGFLSQTEAESIAEMRTAPPSVPVYVALVFTAMSKANEGIRLAWDEKPEEAKAAVLYYSRPGAPPNLDSAAALGVEADEMLRKIHANGDISYELFDQLFRTFQTPLVDVIGEASVAIIAAKDNIARALNWIKSFFVTFESKADVFFQQQAAKVTNLYSGLENRSRTLAALVDSIKANKAYVPSMVGRLPALEQMSAELKRAQEELVKTSAEVEVTPEMLRGQATLENVGLISKLAVRALKLKHLKESLPWRKTAGWLTGPLTKLPLLGMKKLTARGVAKVLWYMTIGIPKFFLFSHPVQLGTAVVAFTFGGKYLDKKYPNLFSDVGPKEDLETAKVTGDKPAEVGAADVLKKLFVAEKTATESVSSLQKDFPVEAALVDQIEGGNDTTWVLYALGGGALVIGLYLYFNRKSQTES